MTCATPAAHAFKAGSVCGLSEQAIWDADDVAGWSIGLTASKGGFKLNFLEPSDNQIEASYQFRREGHDFRLIGQDEKASPQVFLPGNMVGRFGCERSINYLTGKKQEKNPVGQNALKSVDRKKRFLIRDRIKYEPDYLQDFCTAG